MKMLKPLIEQRADPHVLRHADGYYYFTGSVPSYDGIELRRSRTLARSSWNDAGIGRSNASTRR